MFVSLTSVKGQIKTTYYDDLVQGDSVVNFYMDVIKSSSTLSKTIKIAKIDVSNLYKEDEKKSIDVPHRFGKGIELNLTLSNGNWIDINSGRLWSLTIEADSAVSLNFIFKDFHLPENAELFIVNHDNSIVYGPVTSHSISNEKHFLTDIIPDSRATILLYEPFSSQGLSSLTINKVIYGYNSVLFNQENRLENPTDSCQIDVPCYPSCEPEAKAVALVLSADGEWCCSGSLVMSTDLSFKPYFLTAFRCIDSDNNGVLSETEISDAQNWMFKFRQ